jgi:hypothetical protein
MSGMYSKLPEKFIQISYSKVIPPCADIIGKQQEWQGSHSKTFKEE